MNMTKIVWKHLALTDKNSSTCRLLLGNCLAKRMTHFITAHSIYNQRRIVILLMGNITENSNKALWQQAGSG